LQHEANLAKFALEKKERLERDIAFDWVRVFEDNFSDRDPRENWNVANLDKEIWRTGQKEFVVPDGVHGFIAQRKAALPGDQRLDFECHIDSGKPDGIRCFILVKQRKEGESEGGTPDHAYEFVYGGSGKLGNAILREGKPLIERPASPLTLGKTYHVRAEKHADRLSLWINDAPILSAVDPQPLSGPERTLSGLACNGGETHWSNVTFYVIAPGKKADLLELAQRMYDRGKFDAARELFGEVATCASDDARKEAARKGREMVEHKLEGEQPKQEREQH
jgi:hypothetical protein